MANYINAGGVNSAQPDPSAYAGAQRAKKHGVLRTLSCVLGIMALLAVVYAALLAMSIGRVESLAQDAASQYSTLRTSVGSLQIDDLKSQAESIDATSDAMQKEVDSWVWSVAQVLPTYGQDVETIRELIAINSQVADDVLMPVAEAGQRVSDDGVIANGQVDPLALATHAGDLTSLIDAVLDTKDTVQDVSQKLNGLPDTHFEKVNEAVAQIRDASSQITDAFDMLESFKGYLSFAS